MQLLPRYTRAFLLLLTLFLFCPALYGQGDVYVDEQGVMRWQSNDTEIQGFGVNYTVPFAHAYRSAKRMGVDPLRAIDQDVYHFSRLGFDLFRVHVWDTEISDSLGNLLFNEHLHAFDYLLYQLKQRNIRFVLTPIAFWGNGWPEPDEDTPGFSHKYGKGDCLTDPEAIKAQENYLFQFMNHVNPYTGVAYKNEPDLIAIEISNEPHHREAPEAVTAFVQRMVAAVKKTGYTKPIFYNISHSVHLVDDYFAAGIDGGTFQWYPTGLGYQRELPGNVLPHVDRYEIPFDPQIKKHKGAKLVYEFDAADIGKPYVYPAMARSFRTAGIQIATHFAYDPLYLAYANTEYNTHYMNLAYAPQKALALLISGEVFHEVPMYKDYGSYPDNTTFDDFSVSYEQNLALYNNGEKFFYTSPTETAPVRPGALKQIAGYGSSPVVSYNGTGAYFLDQLEAGVWRLEVMPDALIIANPYGRNSPNKTVAVIQWNERNMEVWLDDLGAAFQVQAINAGNEWQTSVANGKFSVRPGTYLLTKPGKSPRWKAQDRFRTMQLGEFVAPASTVDQTYVIHEPVISAVAGAPLTITTQIASPNPIEKVQLQVQQNFQNKVIELTHQQGFTYSGEIPAEMIGAGFLSYYLIVRSTEGLTTYPAGKPGLPYQWDFYAREPYTVRVLEPSQPLYLFTAQDQADLLTLSRWSRDNRLVPLAAPQEAEYQIRVEQLFRPDPENQNGTPIYDYSVRYPFGDRYAHLSAQFAGKKELVLTARSLTGAASRIQVALVTRDGTAYGKVITVKPERKDYTISLADLQPVKTVILPRPYPAFLPYYFESRSTQALDLREIQAVQISLGPGLTSKQREAAQGVAIREVYLR